NLVSRHGEDGQLVQFLIDRHDLSAILQTSPGSRASCGAAESLPFWIADDVFEFVLGNAVLGDMVVVPSSTTRSLTSSLSDHSLPATGNGMAMHGPSSSRRIWHS